MTDQMPPKPERKITIRKNGSYLVTGGIPLVRKTQVVSEHGEPIAWKKEGTIPTGEPYKLCRCGASAEMPFCDGAHKTLEWDSAEVADTRTTGERQITLRGGEKITVKYDGYLCMESGFCGNRFTNIKGMMAETGESTVRAQVAAMVERCPSGAYAYSLEESGELIEPDLPEQIAVVTEITDEGPIAGPLWVTGNIPIERTDGQCYEVRNRVTLCRCGKSKNMPLCDGIHRQLKIKP